MVKLQEHSPAHTQRVAELFREHGPFVFRSLHYLGVPEREVPDMVQNVFMIVHRKLDSFEGKSAMRTWLYGISYRVAAGHRRTARSRLEVVTDEPPERQVEATQGVDLERRQTLQKLNSVIAKLPEEQRDVFVLFEIEELPMKEVATLVGCPLQTAYSRLHKARDEVRRAFDRARVVEKGSVHARA